MQVIISDASPALYVSYDRIRHSIQAHFSKPASRPLTRAEEETMLLIKDQFERKTCILVGLAVDRGLLAEIKHICAEAISDAYQQTGVKFELDAQYLTY